MNSKEYSVSILIVDDDAEARFWNQLEVKKLFSELSSTELNIKLAESKEEMFSYLKAETFHVVLLDRDLGKDENFEMIDGIELIPNIIELQPNTRVLVVTSFQESELAVKAIKNGATDFVTKGESDSDIEYSCQQILKALRDSKFDIDMLKRSINSNSSSDVIVYKSRAMRELNSKLKILSEVNTPVLLLGDSGLGKTHAAKQLSTFSKLHYGQKERVFINVNINAIPENLIESELFGSEEGAFTGAKRRKLGYFELAHGGDLFLDEIGDASLELQGKLLKVIEEREIMRVGGKQKISVNPRIIFATNKDLKELVKQKKFREDLYARICTVVIKMPPLEKRKEDIPFICETICQAISKENRKKISFNDFPKELKEHFLRDSIPFNIRGIRNDLERLSVFCKTRSNGKLEYSNWRNLLKSEPSEQNKLENISFDKLIELISEKILSDETASLPKAKKDLEIASIKLALSHKGFSKKFSKAKALGISDSSLSQKISKYIGGDQNV